MVAVAVAAAPAAPAATAVVESLPYGPGRGVKLLFDYLVKFLLEKPR